MNFRLIPIAIFIAVLMLTVRIGDLWSIMSAPNTFDEEEGQQASLDIGGPAEAQDDGAADEGMESGGAMMGETQQSSDVPEGMRPLEMTDEEVPDFSASEDGLRPGELRLMHDLAKRRELLDERKRSLDEREAVLAAAEQKLVEKQRQLEGLKKRIENLVTRYDQTQEEETSVLRQTYQNMKPKAAAAIFNDLDMETLLDVVRGMPARKLAPILADMSPEKARLVTQELALREELPTVPQ